MKIILTAVNAKYIHSNLAVYTLQASAEKAGVFPEIREFTINQSKDSMLRSLFLAHADVVCVSCYIWNISIVEDLITEYHKIMRSVSYLEVFRHNIQTAWHLFHKNLPLSCLHIPVSAPLRQP